MTWRKSWSNQNLDPKGTKRRLTPVQRSVWDDCLDLAEMSSATGSLCILPNVRYTSEQLAAIFNTPKATIEECLKLFERMRMLKKNGEISNWKIYQSEYQRQKDYRYKLQEGVTNNVHNTDTESDTDTEIYSKVPPTLEEVVSYFKEKQIFDLIEPRKFWSFYDSKGWFVGKNKMKKWRSAAAGWISRGNIPTGKPRLDDGKVDTRPRYTDGKLVETGPAM